MSINYSLYVQSVDPKDPDSEKKVYAKAQSIGTKTLSQLAKHIAEHNSKYNRADVEGVLNSLLDCIKELLLDGWRIQLGELGTFYCNFRCKGADSVDEFTVANILRVLVNWNRGEMFKNLLSEVEFTYVGRRQAQKKTLEEEKDALRALMGETTSSSSSGDSSSGNSSDSTGTSGSGSGDNGDGAEGSD
ncbi:MAG: HU family DNA-binding protein [Prevotellaceae bacterium]|nr:HU family DNA-binding protein [Prevotellaceae bacterium]